MVCALAHENVGRGETAKGEAGEGRMMRAARQKVQARGGVLGAPCGRLALA